MVKSPRANAFITGNCSQSSAVMPSAVAVSYPAATSIGMRGRVSSFFSISKGTTGELPNILSGSDFFWIPEDCIKQLINKADL